MNMHSRQRSHDVSETSGSGSRHAQVGADAALTAHDGCVQKCRYPYYLLQIAQVRGGQGRPAPFAIPSKVPQTPNLTSIESCACGWHACIN